LFTTAIGYVYKALVVVLFEYAYSHISVDCYYIGLHYVGIK